MNEPKPFASLSSGLLARKGAAKPAMRPQMFGQVGANLDDLGWNDMGGNLPGPEPVERVPSSIEALTPAPHAPRPIVEEEPPVVAQQRALEASFPPEEPPAFAETQPKVVPLPARTAPSTAARAKAAFTLRLEEARHLRLRLACAVQHRSAQQLVTEALDRFLETVPELDTLAQHVPPQASKRN
jgi:hypothetical protein